MLVETFFILMDGIIFYLLLNDKNNKGFVVKTEISNELSTPLYPDITQKRDIEAG